MVFCQTVCCNEVVTGRHARGRQEILFLGFRRGSILLNLGDTYFRAWVKITCNIQKNSMGQSNVHHFSSWLTGLVIPKMSKVESNRFKSRAEKFYLIRLGARRGFDLLGSFSLKGTTKCWPLTGQSYSTVEIEHASIEQWYPRKAHALGFSIRIFYRRARPPKT